jgi:hypothetical protein
MVATIVNFIEIDGQAPNDLAVGRNDRLFSGSSSVLSVIMVPGSTATHCYTEMACEHVYSLVEFFIMKAPTHTPSPILLTA